MEIVVVSNKEQRNDAYFVRKAVFVEEQNVSVEEEIDEFEDTAIHFVVYDEGQPIGAGRLRTVEEFGKVERICILSSKRGTGVGKLLMDAIEQEGVKHGLTKFKLNAQTQAEAFYKKLGYVTISDDIFLDAGIPHVTMVKHIL